MCDFPTQPFCQVRLFLLSSKMDTHNWTEFIFDPAEEVWVGRERKRKIKYATVFPFHQPLRFGGSGEKAPSAALTE